MKKRQTIKRKKAKEKVPARLWLAQSVAWFALATGRLFHLVALLVEGVDEWWEAALIVVSVVLFFVAGILSLINYRREKKKVSVEQEPTEQENSEQA